MLPCIPRASGSRVGFQIPTFSEGPSPRCTRSRFMCFIWCQTREERSICTCKLWMWRPFIFIFNLPKQACENSSCAHKAIKQFTSSEKQDLCWFERQPSIWMVRWIGLSQVIPVNSSPITPTTHRQDQVTPRIIRMWYLPLRHWRLQRKPQAPS